MQLKDKVYRERFPTSTRNHANSSLLFSKPSICMVHQLDTDRACYWAWDITKVFNSILIGYEIWCLRPWQKYDTKLKFVSLLSHFWLIHLLYLHLLYQPYVGLCQATRVQSHQRQSTSAVAIATCEVQVSAADYQTVPTVATGVSKPLCCRLTLTFTLTSENLSLYITLLL